MPPSTHQLYIISMNSVTPLDLSKVKQQRDQVISPRDPLPKNFYKKAAIQQQLQQKISHPSAQDLASIMMQQRRPKKAQQKDEPRSRNSNKPTAQEEEEVIIGRISVKLQQTMVEIEESNMQPKKSHLDINMWAIIRVQQWARKMRAKKLLQYLKKQQRYRKFVITELIETENNYLESMKTLHEFSKQSIIIINTQQQQILFSNLQQIIELSKNFLEDMRKAFQEFEPRSIFAGKIIHYTKFFKIYILYYGSYDQAAKLLKDLKQDKQFAQDLRQLEKVYLKKNLEDYMIQPIQRLPKYALLFQDLLKNTDPQHPDYKNIEQILMAFKLVTDENNQNMDKMLKNMKLFELQKLFGQSCQVIQATRNYLREDSMNVYFSQEGEARPCIVYFLTDLIIITERVQTKSSGSEYVYRNSLKLTANSICRELEELQHLSNLFQVTGDGSSIIFKGLSEDDRQIQIEQIRKQIAMIQDTLQKRQEALEKNNKNINLLQNKLITIQIVGTQEATDAQAKKYTQYIIEVQIQNITQKIYIRFKQFEKLQEYVQKNFQQLKIQFYKDDNFILKTQSLTIEKRKIAILDVLSVILNSKEVQARPGEVLKMLTLPENFYDLPNLLNQQDGNLQEELKNFRTLRKFTSLNSGAIDKIRSNMKKGQDNYMSGPMTPRGDPVRANQQFTNSNQSTIAPGQPKRANSQAPGKHHKISASKIIQADSRNNSKRGSFVETDEVFPVEIRVLIFTALKQEEKPFLISKETNAGHLVEEIARLIDLQSAFDFKLYLPEKSGLKHIEEDQMLWSFLVREEESKGLFKKATKKYVYNETRLHFRKHLFFSAEVEKESYQDLIRVQLITYQLLDDITSYKLILILKEYALYTALYLYINGVQHLTEDSIPYQKIKQFLPSIVLKNIDTSIWKNFLPTMFLNFGTQIKELEEKQQQETHRKKHDEQKDLNITMSDDGIEIKKNQAQYAMLVFLDLITTTQFYGFAVFVVTPDKETFSLLDGYCRAYQEKQRQLKKVESNNFLELKQSLLFCVNYKGITLYKNYKSNQELLNIDFKEVLHMQSFPTTLVVFLEFNNQQNLESTSTSQNFEISKRLPVKFDTEKGYQIKSLFDEYREASNQSFDEINFDCNEILQQN